jgi:hypothetical protein
MVASFIRAYLLVIVNISSDVLGFLMASLRIKDESLSPFLKNMMMDLLSTSRMMFLLLQKRWINSQRGSPFFSMMLARSHSTLGHAHMAQKLLMNYWHRSDHDQIDPVGSPMSHVLDDDDDRQIGK